MKALLLSIVLLLPGCGLFRFPSPAAPEVEPPKVDVIARAIQNTVRLVDGDDWTFCSGVLAEGVVFSAYHCIDGKDKFIIETTNGKQYTGVVAFPWPERDLAVLTAVGLKMKDTVPLAEAAPGLGHKVVWVGFPLGADLQMGTGIVSNANPNETYFDVQGQIIPGHSGGPVFNEFGRLVGIMSATQALPGFPIPQLLPIGHVVRWENLKTAVDSL